MQLHERPIGNTVVLDVKGPITSGRSTREFRDKIDSLVARGQKQIVINLGGVSHVDSAGLGELIAARAAVSTHGGRIRLVNVTQRIDELLIVTKLATIFDICLSEHDALAGFD